MENCLSYTSTGIGMQSVMEDKSATGRDSSQIKPQSKGK